MTNQQNERSNNGKRIVLIMLAILLIAAIAFGAYTYSKYVTSKERSGGAQVAKWGFTVTIGDSTKQDYTDSMGFANDYDANGALKNETSAIISANTASTNVVAPGAKGGTSFSVSGTAEVLAKLTAGMTGTQIFINIKDENGNTYQYKPVVYTYGSVSGDISEINTELEKLEQTIQPNKSVTIANNDITWEWAFEATEGLTLDKVSGDGADTLKISADDVNVLDTALAQLMAGEDVTTKTISVASVDYTIQTTTQNTDYCLKESATLKITLTQVQSAN